MVSPTTAQSSVRAFFFPPYFLFTHFGVNQGTYLPTRSKWCLLAQWHLCLLDNIPWCNTVKPSTSPNSASHWDSAKPCVPVSVCCKVSVLLLGYHKPAVFLIRPLFILCKTTQHLQLVKRLLQKILNIGTIPFTTGQVNSKLTTVQLVPPCMCEYVCMSTLRFQLVFVEACGSPNSHFPVLPPSLNREVLTSSCVSEALAVTDHENRQRFRHPDRHHTSPTRC